MADPLVAHEAANVINELVDREFPSNEGRLRQWLWRVTGARSRFAERQGTTVAVQLASQAVKHERMDPLTGLGNKVAYRQDRSVLYANLADGEEIIIVRFDMGMLNYFNQVRGHAEGDKYLQEAARLVDGASFPEIAALFRQCDFARGYREGGDEFALLIKVPKDRTNAVLQALREKAYEKMNDLNLPGGDFVLGYNGSLTVGRQFLLDMGFSTASESREVLEKIGWRSLKRDSHGAALLGAVADRIADARVDVSKARKRIRTLRDVFLSDRSAFRALYPFAAKGALAIEEEELGRLSDDENIKQFVARVFAARLKNDARRASDRFQRRLALILSLKIPALVHEE